MGKGFEQPLARGEGFSSLTQELALEHTLDESHHMALSCLLAEAGKELVGAPQRRREGRAYARLLEGVSRSVIRYTFGQPFYKAHEVSLSRAALGRIPALAQRSAAFRDELVVAHFASTSGIERGRNRVMARPNRRILSAADLSERHRRAWREELAAGQGNLRFLEGEPVAAKAQGRPG
ncbi:MAG: hypothetical protein JKY65_26095 [Planctomycetes bacterium]|nr:hypothetical protein [Planctomycetota bacterium]